jgi:hypothetical protein
MIHTLRPSWIDRGIKDRVPAALEPRYNTAQTFRHYLLLIGLLACTTWVRAASDAATKVLALEHKMTP